MIEGGNLEPYREIQVGKSASKRTKKVKIRMIKEPYPQLGVPQNISDA